MSLADRTRDICGQLDRYGQLASEELADVLCKITDINDDIINGRDPAGIREMIREAKELLDKVPVERGEA